MSTEENKAIVRRFNAELFNEKRLDRVDEFIAPDYVDHGAVPGQGPGLEGAKQKWAMYLAAIPDLRISVEDLFAAEDRVGVRWTGEGTQQGELLGIARTGLPVRISGISIFRVADGKVAEQWEEWDKLQLVRQLGVLPPSAHPAD